MVFLQQLSFGDVQRLDREMHSMLHKRVLHSAKGISEKYLDKLFWEFFPDDWTKLSSPVRPSCEDTFFYRDIVRGFDQEKQVRILVLGSTPELRNVVAERGYERTKVYVADFSYNRLAAHALLGSRIEEDKEVWIKENWLMLPFSNFFFDIILGDLALQQFRPEQERLFLEKIRRMLAPRGVCALRLQFLGPECVQESMRSIVEDVARLPICQNEKFHNIKTRVRWLSADLHDRTFDDEKTYRNFKTFVSGEAFVPPYLVRAQKNFEYCRQSYRNWCPPSRDALLEMLAEEFIIDSEVTSRDYPCAKYYPLYKLSPKLKLVATYQKLSKAVYTSSVDK